MAIGPSAALALEYLTDVFNRRQLGRRTPATKPANHAAQDALYDAYEKRVGNIGAGRKPMDIDLDERLPPDNFNSFIPANVNDYAGNGINRKTGNNAININPNVDEAYLAHELGHIASKHTDIGALVRNLRGNPKLTEALFASAAITPFAAAALEAGDNDLDTSMALAGVSALPNLIDEGLATKNGLAIMDIAGRRATMGQRGKLAAGYLSYLMPAIAAGVGGNYFGNLVDKDI